MRAGFRLTLIVSPSLHGARLRNCQQRVSCKMTVVQVRLALPAPIDPPAIFGSRPLPWASITANLYVRQHQSRVVSFTVCFWSRACKGHLLVVANLGSTWARGLNLLKEALPPKPSGAHACCLTAVQRISRDGRTCNVIGKSCTCSDWGWQDMNARARPLHRFFAAVPSVA